MLYLSSLHVVNVPTVSDNLAGALKEVRVNY